MSVPLWVADLAAEFWKLARAARPGEPGPFPRNLRAAIAFALPMRSVPVPGLTVANLATWLADRGIACPRLNRNGRLRGGVVGCNGHGFAFVDSDDPEPEQRYTLGHELAHFLRHYWQPRQRAVGALGNEVLEVFDGRRAATVREEIGALLRHVRLTGYVHLMERDRRGRPSQAVAFAEAEADRLAFELLAPEEAVRSEGSSQPLVERLQQVFGLPPAQARRYAALLTPQPPVEGFLLRLRVRTEASERET